MCSTIDTPLHAHTRWFWATTKSSVKLMSRKNKVLAEWPDCKKSRKQVLMQLLSQDKKKGGKWVSHDCILGGENHPAFALQKNCHTFFVWGFQFNNKGEFRPAPPPTPTKPTSDQRLQLAAATATVAIPWEPNRCDVGWKEFGWCWGDLRTFQKRVQVTSRRNLLTFWIEGIYLLVAFWFPIGTYLFDWIWKLKKKTR